MIAWCFQTAGILLGAHWAYAVLGWGGYWGWDPVENASLLPWLTGTAFLHSVMMQEKRGMMKVWNVWLVFLTFMLCILGTTLTRSGIVSSVHAFAQSSIGNWFVGFSGVDSGGVFRGVRQESRLFEERESAGFDGFARVELPVQQFDFAGFVHGGFVGHAVSGVFGMAFGFADQRWARRFSTR